MGFLAVVVGITLIVAVLWDALETIVLPRTVARRVGLSSLFIEVIWHGYRLVGKAMSTGQPWRERLLGAFGPVSLLLLIIAWAWLLIFAFALVSWGFGVQLAGTNVDGLPVHIYASAVTFFTVGYGDVT